MKVQAIFSRILMSVAILILFTESAYAYLDPGTGSIILQGLIAGIAVGLSTFKLWWYRFSGLFARKKKEPEEATEE